ncbi:hypothetical protein F5X97DRAFT_321506 [Nemania serpens]|nr:hypothetical protein F5X97DRAFT_321506 [Nemania serpens]
MSLSTETIVNIVFGIVACTAAIGSILATVCLGRQQRCALPILQDTLPSSIAVRRRQTFNYLAWQPQHDIGTEAQTPVKGQWRLITPEEIDEEGGFLDGKSGMIRYNIQ